MKGKKNWLVELEQYEQTMYNIINLLNFNKKQQQLLQVKHKDKLKEKARKEIQIIGTTFLIN